MASTPSPPSTSSSTTPGPTTSSTTTPPTGPPTNPPPPPPPTSSSTTPLPPTSSSTTPDISTSSTALPQTSSTTLIPTSSSTTSTPTPVFTTPTLPLPVTTVTSVTTATSSRNVAPTGAADASSSSNKGFFHNTGAVAGVFTVVGLIVLAIFIAFITNCIRRRRAKKFDDEIAAAARDAANTQVPNFAYEDDDELRPGGGYGGAGAGVGGKFSDVSHGSYAQPPMSVPESYGMRELPHQGLNINPGEYYDSSSSYASGAASGAAGIGVARARSMRDGGYAAGLTEGSSPYAAFVAPGGKGTGPQYPPGMIRGAGSPEFDLNRRPSQYTQQSQQSGQPTDYAALARNKSQTTNHSSSAPSYQSDQQFYTNANNNNGGYGQQGGYPNSYGAYTTGAPPGAAAGPAASGGNLQPIPASRSEEDLNDAYGGYVVNEPPAANRSSPTGHLPNPFSGNPANRPAEYADDSDDEVEEPKRILKVANE